LIDELKSLGTKGKISHSEEEVGGLCEIKGGPAPQSTAGDGIPDDWKKSRGLDVKNPTLYKGDRDGDGFTNLEEYLNGIVNSSS
jgi:hypothetical protein